LEQQKEGRLADQEHSGALVWQHWLTATVKKSKQAARTFGRLCVIG